LEQAGVERARERCEDILRVHHDITHELVRDTANIPSEMFVRTVTRRQDATTYQ
jgi:hypothetical protein